MTDTTVQVKDAVSATKNMRVQDQGAAGLVPYRIEDNTQRAALIAALASVGQPYRVTGSVLTRPADTVQYAVGDLIANNTVAASVTPITFALARANDQVGIVKSGTLILSGSSLTSSNFRLHLFSQAPAPVNGDNAAFSVAHTGYLGCIDFGGLVALSDGAWADGIPAGSRGEITFQPGTGVTTVWGLLEARDVYTPISAETFTVTLECK